MQEESNGKQQLTTKCTAGRDDIPPSSVLSDGDCRNRDGGPISEGSYDMHCDLGCRHFLGQRKMTFSKLALRTYSHMTENASGYYFYSHHYFLCSEYVCWSRYERL